MEQLRGVLEIVYFLSGPIIIILVFLALQQLKVTKKNAEMHSKREAYTSSAEQIKYYNERIIPLCNKFDKIVEKNDIKFFKESKVTITGERIKIKYPGKIIKEALTKVVVSELNDLLNYLECFAVFFTSGVADEKVAYSPLGQTYCNQVKNLLPIIMIVITDKNGNVDRDDYDQLLKLFFLWNGRIEKTKLISEKKKIEEELSKIDDKYISPLKK